MYTVRLHSSLPLNFEFHGVLVPKACILEAFGALIMKHYESFLLILFPLSFLCCCQENTMQMEGSDVQVTKGKRCRHKFDKSIIPPGKWRVGLVMGRTGCLFLRFATKGLLVLDNRHWSRTVHTIWESCCSDEATAALNVSETRTPPLNCIPCTWGSNFGWRCMIT